MLNDIRTMSASVFSNCAIRLVCKLSVTSNIFCTIHRYNNHHKISSVMIQIIKMDLDFLVTEVIFELFSSSTLKYNYYCVC